MPDALTPAEREAIARYTGPIRVIPRGVSGLAEYGEAVPLRAQIAANFKTRRVRRPAAAIAALPPMTRRDDETDQDAAKRLQRQGRTMREIAAFLSIPLKRVFKFCNAKGGNQ